VYIYAHKLSYTHTYDHNKPDREIPGYIKSHDKLKNQYFRKDKTKKTKSEG
jgi:hypothetical protein